MSFEQATVLVTGGTSGIGRAPAQLFGHHGAKVVASGCDEARGREVAAETGGRFIRADLASPEDVRRLAAEAGEVDVLVNNAGFWELGPTGETTEAGFEAMAAVNFRAPFGRHQGCVGVLIGRPAASLRTASARRDAGDQDRAAAAQGPGVEGDREAAQRVFRDLVHARPPVHLAG